ncbi:MAG: hypothetical protein LIO55_08380 [Oscillospiraceae bacterium]|nr:hypothetical protein [Oscillospiraceae bacterium]
MKGLAGGIIGEMNLVSCTGDAVSTVAIDYVIAGGANTGHAFIVYESYVNDVLDFSVFNRGFATSTNRWSNAEEQTSTGRYSFNANDIATLGAGGFAMSDAKCAVYNMELFKHYVKGESDYSSNAYVTKKVTYSDVQKMLNAFSKESEEEYRVVFHNCTHVALNVWNEVFDTGYDPFGLNTPRNLYNYLIGIGGLTSYMIENHCIA